jgi:hypothetical protein
MKKNCLSLFLALLTSAVISTTVSAQTKDAYTYKPGSVELSNTILHMDSVYFNAYNTCDMDKQAAITPIALNFTMIGAG